MARATFFKTLLIAALSAFVISSCGGTPAAPLNATIGPQFVGNFKTALQQIPNSNTVPSLPVQGGAVSTSAIAPQATGFGTCYKSTPTSPVDADGDGVALKKSYIFDCTDLNVSGTTYTHKGSFTSQDLDDTKAGAAGGYQYDYNMTEWTSVDSSQNKYRYSYVGTANFKQVGSTFVYKNDFSGTYYYKSAVPYHGITAATDYKYRHVWDSTWIPDSAGSPWTMATHNFTGRYEMSGTFLSEVGGNHKLYDGAVVMNFTGKSLRYQTGCSVGYQSGDVTMDDGFGNILKITYLCSSVTITMNGQKVDWTY